MKKTGFVAAIAALSAAAGALAVGAVYLRRREKELDEYEELLFGDDEMAPEEEQEVEIEIDSEQVCEAEAVEAPAEEAPVEEPAEEAVEEPADETAE